MAFVRVRHTDLDLVEVYVDLVNAAQRVDDPDGWPAHPGARVGDIEFGYDLHPDEYYLYVPDGETDPVGVLIVDMPTRDNLHLVWSEITVHPEHRRRGHGSAIMAELLRRTQAAGRTTVWIGTAEDDLGAQAFLHRFGFVHSSHDARRRQVLADVDPVELERHHAGALAASADYRLERLMSPVADEVLVELVEVTAAINDAPMGDLDFEDEKFDLQRLRDGETARTGRREAVYRLVARHRETGEAGGHTVMITHPLLPDVAFQGDTAVARGHRGHRLGMLLKIEMMRWLAEAEPDVKTVETWNQADNSFMISVNESLGYRLSRVFATYQLVMPQD